MRIGTIVEYTDWCFVDIVRITDGEFFIKAHTGRENKTLPCTKAGSPPEESIVLHPETTLEFQRHMGQADEHKTGRDTGIGIHCPFIRTMEIIVAVLTASPTS